MVSGNYKNDAFVVVRDAHARARVRARVRAPRRQFRIEAFASWGGRVVVATRRGRREKCFGWRVGWMMVGVGDRWEEEGLWPGRWEEEEEKEAVTWRKKKKEETVAEADVDAAGRKRE